MSLIVELQVGGSWRRVGVIRPGDPGGSMSDNVPQDGASSEGGGAVRRDVLHFFCDEGGSRVMRSKGGVDVATPEWRATFTEGLELVKALAPGQSWERMVTLDSGLRAVVRYTHEREEGSA